MTQYIHELSDWPAFSWNEREISPLLASVRFRQGSLIGQMKSIGFGIEKETAFQVITEDVIKTSQIEGEIFETDVVRSAIARRLGIDIGGLRDRQ